MIVAAESLGHSCFWKTGAWAYSPSVRQRFGLGDDTVITGFLGLGTRASERRPEKESKRPQFGNHFEYFDAWLARVGTRVPYRGT